MKKLKKNGGFTLVEMLIVVAIIAILVAVSIPMISNALEKTREAVDQANIRDALALGTIEVLAENKPAGTTGDTTEYSYVVNDSHQGKLSTSTTTETGYSTVSAQCACNNVSDPLKVTVNWKTGEVTANWKSVDGKTTANNTTNP